MEITNLLTPWQWAVLVGVPVGIIVLYFLKLRRSPLLVPSTMLWKRSIEDLRANSLFQRLRRNLLLFLQLMAVLLLMLALLGLRSDGTNSIGQKYVLMIDNSASMSANDVSPTRLDRAKAEALKVVDSMAGDDQALVIAFSNDAQVVSSFSSNRGQLRARIQAIRPTNGTTSLRQALQVAQGLANPRAQDVPEGVVATEFQDVPPRLLIFSDGGFPDVTDFNLGTLVPQLIVVGQPSDPVEPDDDSTSKGRMTADGTIRRPSNNLALEALQTRRDDLLDERFQVFGRVRNHRPEQANVSVQLLRHDPNAVDRPGELVDAIELEIEPGDDRAFAFPRTDTGDGELLEVALEVEDDLPLDDRGFALIRAPREAQIMLVTTGNRFLSDTLSTGSILDRSRVAVIGPQSYNDEAVQREVLLGRYDLVVFDRIQPEQSPQANTLYFGAFPPEMTFAEPPNDLEQPVILDWDISHPLLQYIRDLRTVAIVNARGVEPPPGSRTLIESEQGALAFVAPREGFSDVILTFPLLDEEDKANTNWPARESFPLFMFNALQVLGNVGQRLQDGINRAGEPIRLRAEGLAETMTISKPDGSTAQLQRKPQGFFLFAETDQIGLYTAQWSGAETPDLAFAINLFDRRESDIAPRGLSANEGQGDGNGEESPETPDAVKIGYTPISGQSTIVEAQQDWWKLIAGVVLAIILLEWYIYNKRIYV